MKHLEEGLRRLRDRVQMGVGRCIVAAVKDSTLFQEVQLELLEEETHEGVEHFQPYGFTSHAKAGAEGLMLAVGGLRSHGIAIAVGDRRYRLTSLAEGEVAVYDDQGQKIVLQRDGILIRGKKLTLESEGDIAFTGDGAFSVDVEGAVSIEGASFTADTTGAQQFNSDDISIGNGATKGAARKDDSINDSTDTISGGSAKVKIA